MTTTITTTTDSIQFQCLSTTLNNIGALHYESGRNESALEYLEEAANARTFAMNNSRPFTERDAYRHRVARRDEDHLLQSITEIRRDVVGIPLFSSYRRQRRGQRPPCYDKCYFSQAILLDDDDGVDTNVNALPAAVTMFNMGLVLRSMSLWNMAMSVFELAQREVSPNEYPLLSSAILANIATIHHMEDRDDDALQIFSEVVGIYENEVVNADAISDNAALEQIQRCVGATLSSMALICFRRRKFNDALDLCQDTGNILTMSSERESHDELINMYNESLVLHGKGECEAAFEQCQLVISSATDGRQANHALVGAAWHTMGEIQLEMGYLDDAMISLKQSIKHKKRVYGNYHLDIADIYYDWGCVMTNLGRYLDALSFFKMERDILERLLGNDHMEMIITNCSIAGTYHLMGNLDMSLETYENALQIAKTRSKDDCSDVEVGKIMSTIATIYLEKGDISSANKLFLQVSTISSQIDPEHCDFSSYSNFSQINLCFGLESFPAAPTA